MCDATADAAASTRDNDALTAEQAPGECRLIGHVANPLEVWLDRRGLRGHAIPRGAAVTGRADVLRMAIASPVLHGEAAVDCERLASDPTRSVRH